MCGTFLRQDLSSLTYKKPRGTFVGVDYVHRLFVEGYLEVVHGYSSIQSPRTLKFFNTVPPYRISLTIGKGMLTQ